MIFKQFYLGCLSHASYLIGDKASGAAAVVDPQRDVARYSRFARSNGLKIKHVLLTHFHADFVSGHIELRERGAQVYLGAKARADYAFIPLKEGDALEFGTVRLRILETPGHTPEAISILVYDLKKNAAAPKAVLTGDTLFIGDVGRPDLMASSGVSAKKLAGMLYDSLRLKLLRLPDETLVYPAHGAGSFCGKNLGSETVSTIGAQRRFNYALAPMSKRKFTAMVTADQPKAPGYFAYDAKFNRLDRPTLDSTLKKVKPLTLEALGRLAKKGAQIVDTRDPAEFAAAHLAGSVNIGLEGKFATWAGILLSRRKPIALVAEPGREHESALRLGRIGFDHIAGTLKGGLRALRRRPRLLRANRRLCPGELHSLLDSPAPPAVLDVRSKTERQKSRIAGSLHIPLDELPQRLGEVPSAKPIVVHCAGGYRSSIAASLLKKHGHKDVSDLIGGIAAWEAAGLKTVPFLAHKEGPSHPLPRKGTV